MRYQKRGGLSTAYVPAYFSPGSFQGRPASEQLVHHAQTGPFPPPIQIATQQRWRGTREEFEECLPPPPSAVPSLPVPCRLFYPCALLPAVPRRRCFYTRRAFRFPRRRSPPPPSLLLCNTKQCSPLSFAIPSLSPSSKQLAYPPFHTGSYDPCSFFFLIFFRLRGLVCAVKDVFPKCFHPSRRCPSTNASPPMTTRNCIYWCNTIEVTRLGGNHVPFCYVVSVVRKECSEAAWPARSSCTPAVSFGRVEVGCLAPRFNGKHRQLAADTAETPVHHCLAYTRNSRTMRTA